MTAPIALSMGDPAGVGPELTIRAMQALGDAVPVVYFGDAAQIEGLAGPVGVPVNRVEAPSDAVPGSLNVIDIACPARPVAGQPDMANAACVIACIERAVAATRAGTCSAVVTNPINKQVLIDGADFPYPGHTEFLAALAGTDRSVMMLAAPELKVVPATIHIPVRDVPGALTDEVLTQTITILHGSLKQDFGLTNPVIAVAGLNPHAGEGGHIGREELDFIGPLVARLRETGIDLRGPMSADTMFHAAARATYDAAVCMYHDQALIPIKTLNFSGGVNTTLGLPFIRTSPDHGTAYDIAGKGLADPESLIAAIRLAMDMAAHRARA